MDWSVFIVYFGACVAAGATGSLFPPGKWYRELKKPFFTPPDLAFPIAWTVIYTCSAVAAARVADETGNGMAMALWALQIALNTLWTPVFFGLKRPRAGVIILSSLWLSTFGACVTFWSHDPVAGMLLVPYVIWLTVAAGLNVGVIVLNPPERESVPAE